MPQALRPPTTLRLSTLVLGLLLGAMAAPALAEKADRDKPMIVESDALRYDDLKQLNIYTGRVLLTKGTIVLRGARVEVRQDPEGYQFGTVTAEPGARAFFRQKREGVDEFIEGEGETIYYDGRADTVRFTARAEMRRFKGAQLFDQTSGSLIVYDNNTSVFTVDGGALPGVAGSGGRVRTMLTPTPKPDAARAVPASGPAAALKSSPALEDKK